MDAYIHGVGSECKNFLHGVFQDSANPSDNQVMNRWRKRIEEFKQDHQLTYNDLADKYNAVLETVIAQSGTKSERAKVTMTGGGINHWVTGVREPSITQFLALAKALQVAPETLLFGIVLGSRTVGSREVAEVLTEVLQANPGLLTMPPRASRRKSQKPRKSK